MTIQRAAPTRVAARSVSGWAQLHQVAWWEWRRLTTNRTAWLASSVALGCFGFILLVRNRWPLSDAVVLVGGTANGQLAELAYDLMPMFGIMLAFVAVDAVAIDYQQRTHELLMTSALPSWVYVGGRYLARLTAFLALALVLLIAQLGVNVALARLEPTYPAPQLTANVLLWVVVVVPAAVTLASLGVALGSLLPRYSVVPKVALSIAWVILALDNDPRDLGWRDYWNPTSAGVAKLLLLQLTQLSRPITQGVQSPTEQAAQVLQLQTQPLDLSPWLGPFVTLAAVGVLLVIGAAVSFRRFRGLRE